MSNWGWTFALVLSRADCVGDSEQLEGEMCYTTPCLQINNTLQAFLTPAPVINNWNLMFRTWNLSVADPPWADCLPAKPHFVFWLIFHWIQFRFFLKGFICACICTYYYIFLLGLFVACSWSLLILYCEICLGMFIRSQGVHLKCPWARHVMSKASVQSASVIYKAWRVRLLLINNAACSQSSKQNAGTWPRGYRFRIHQTPVQCQSRASDCSRHNQAGGMSPPAVPNLNHWQDGLTEQIDLVWRISSTFSD